MARSRKTTERPATGKRPIEQYDHKGKQRKNNPPVGLVTEATDRDAAKKRYAYDPHRDPALTWAGKAEHTAFEVPTVSLHVHERIDPKTIVEAVRRRNGAPAPTQGSLFESLAENPPLREAIDFYQHAPRGETAEKGVYVSYPPSLHGEQADEDRDRHRDDVGLEERRCDLEALDGAEHRDGRSDHPVAVEERGAEEPHQDQEARPRPRRRHGSAHEGEEREDTAFALVVGPHDEDQILDRDDDNQRPRDEGENAEHVRARRLDRVGAAEAFA